MTLQKFFLGRAIVLGLLLIIGMVFFVIYKGYFSPTEEAAQNTPTEDTAVTESPIFVWDFQEADSLNLDGNPNTDIFLAVQYSNGVTQNKLIDTTAGSCNELPDTDELVVSNSTIISCYSAGLGYRFKITKGSTSYLVQRKTFEEALPDYNPPPYEYEVVAEFPLSK